MCFYLLVYVMFLLKSIFKCFFVFGWNISNFLCRHVRPIRLRNGPLTGEHVRSHVTSGMISQSWHRGGSSFLSCGGHVNPAAARLPWTRCVSSVTTQGNGRRVWVKVPVGRGMEKGESLRAKWKGREGITFKWQIGIALPELGRKWQRLMDFCAGCD